MSNGAESSRWEPVGEEKEAWESLLKAWHTYDGNPTEENKHQYFQVYRPAFDAIARRQNGLG